MNSSISRQHLAPAAATLEVQKEKRGLERKIDHLQAQLKQSRQQGTGEDRPVHVPDPLMGIARPRMRMPDRMGITGNTFGPSALPLEQLKAQQR